MRKQYGTDWTKLASAQLMHADLMSLVRVLLPDSLGFNFVAEWDSKDGAQGDDASELDEIDDFAGLRRLSLYFVYGKRDNAVLRISTAGSSVQWEGPIGADRARRVISAWAKLRGRARVSEQTAGRIPLLVGIFWSITCVLLSVVTFDKMFVLGSLPQTLLNSFSILWPVFLAAGVTTGFAGWIVNRENSLFAAQRAKQHPFVMAPAKTFVDMRTRLLSMATLIGTIAAVVSAVTDVVGD